MWILLSQSQNNPTTIQPVIILNHNYKLYCNWWCPVTTYFHIPRTSTYLYLLNLYSHEPQRSSWIVVAGLGASQLPWDQTRRWPLWLERTLELEGEVELLLVRLVMNSYSFMTLELKCIGSELWSQADKAYKFHRSFCGTGFIKNRSIPLCKL